MEHAVRATAAAAKASRSALAGVGRANVEVSLQGAPVRPQMIRLGRTLRYRPARMLVNDMREVSVRRRDAAADFGRQHALCTEATSRMFTRTPGVRVVAARVEVDSCIARLGPGMDRKVRFGDHDHAGDAVGLEPVEGYLEYFGIRFARRVDHSVADGVEVGQGTSIATRQLADDVSPACIQLLLFSSGLAGKSHLQARRLARAVHLRPRPIDELFAGDAERSACGRLAAMARRACRPSSAFRASHPRPEFVAHDTPLPPLCKGVSGGS